MHLTYPFLDSAIDSRGSDFRGVLVSESMRRHVRSGAAGARVKIGPGVLRLGRITIT